MIDLTNLPPGLVGCGDSKKGISAFLQHRVAGAWTHLFMTDYPDGTEKQFNRIFEADKRVSHALWKNYLADSNFNFRLYEVIGATKEETDYALDKCKELFLGDGYGYLGWPYFAFQMFCRRVLHLDIRKNKNWITAGTICTELFYWYLWHLTDLHPEKWGSLRLLLNEWSADAMTSNDATHLLEQNQQWFRLVFEKE